jgi:CubicO group peptidase (beta-lactamase class C family)
MWERTSSAARAGGFNGFLMVADANQSHGADLGRPGVGGPDWRWASVTKQLLATLVMQQVDAGRLSLDTAIATYAPTLRIANADKVTLRQLLQHTSGLPNINESALDATGTMPAVYVRGQPQPMVNAGPGVGLNAACTGPARAEAGASFAYNNCDSEVVGVVLEAVTGKPLAELFETQLFQPLGMAGVRLLKAGDASGRVGFLPDDKPDDFIDVGRYGAGGSVAGPPEAVVRFDQALMSGKLLSPAARAEMWNGDPKLGFAALHQWVYEVPLKGCAAPVQLVERRGSIGGVEIRNVIAPELGLIVIAFADRPVDFGEPWQGKGATYDLLSAAFCGGKA